MEKIIALLNLTEDATPEVIEEKIAELIEANKDLTEAANVATEKIQELESELESLKAKKGTLKIDISEKDEPFKAGNPLGNKELKTFADSVLKQSDVAKVYATQDGQIFIDNVAAKNHKRVVGGKLITFNK